MMMDRPDAALKDLANPAIGDQHDAPLWRALAYAKQGKWAHGARQLQDASKRRSRRCRSSFSGSCSGTRCARPSRSAISPAQPNSSTISRPSACRDCSPHRCAGRPARRGHGPQRGCARRLSDRGRFLGPAGRGAGQIARDRFALRLGDIKREDGFHELETLTTIWRGDETEIEALEILARLYTEEGRYRDSFYVMRSALAAHPNSDMTRRIQDEAAATFDRCSSPARAMRCRPSMRWRCSTTFAS